ncbi:MAG: hypothetical protein WCF16_05650 [Alphaproteobacteria bacterium]
MTQFVSYEIHTYRAGQWKIDSVYDDREIAVYEAQRLQGTGRFAALRVVEEKFDSDSGKILNKTVFRAAKVDESNAEALEHQKAVRQEAQAKAAKKAPAGEFKKTDAPSPDAKSSGFSPIVLTLTLGAIVLAGIGAIVGLRYIAGAM